MAKAMMALMLVVVIAPVQAADDVSSAKSMVDALAKEAISSITNKTLSPEDKKARFAKLFARDFNGAQIGKFALGRYNKQLTSAQRTEYNSLFSKMVVAIYTARFEQYSGETVTITGARKDEKSGDVLVNSLINQPGGGQPVPVDWRVRSGKIIDVFVAGISMSQTQRDDFASVIAKGNGTIEALLVYLRQKV